MTMTSTPSPRTTEILSERECWDLLRQSVVGRLAVVLQRGRRAVPEIVPVNHVVDLGTVVIRTSAGSTLAHAADRPVAFEVDGYDAARGAAWSVVLHGVARKALSDGGDRRDGLDRRTMALLPWEQGRKPWLLRIEPDGPEPVTGRRIYVTGGLRDAISGPKSLGSRAGEREVSGGRQRGDRSEWRRP